MTSRPRTLLAAAAPLALAVWGTVRSRRRAAAHPADTHVPQPTGEPRASTAGKPTTAADSSEPATPKHLLTAVHGVGPKIAAALAAAGIEDLAALAVATEAQLLAALEKANIRRAANMENWAAQARAFMEDNASRAAGVNDSSGAGRAKQ
jgi:predicted flap endonuclease-1-like 5' DNA nuclease